MTYEPVVESLSEAQRAFFAFVRQYRSRAVELHSGIIREPIQKEGETQRRTIHFIYGMPEKGIYHQVVSVMLVRPSRTMGWNATELVHTLGSSLGGKECASIYAARLDSDARYYFVPKYTTSEARLKIIQLQREGGDWESESRKLPQSFSDPIFPS